MEEFTLFITASRMLLQADQSIRLQYSYQIKLLSFNHITYFEKYNKKKSINNIGVKIYKG
jgi:hypothetical protein